MPKSTCQNHNCKFLLTTHTFLYIEKSEETYFDFSDFGYCKKSKDYHLCPEIYLLQSRQAFPSCATYMLQNPENISSICEIANKQISSLEFTNLFNRNSWMYVANNNTITLVCPNQNEQILLDKVGIISIRENCRIYTDKIIEEI